MAINGVRAKLRAIPRKTAVVEIEGSPYTVREMTGTERDKFEIESIRIGKGGDRTVEMAGLKARLVAMCLLDEDGATRVYQDSEVKELNDELGGLTVQALFEAAQKLNGLGATAVEDAAKNSETGPTAGLSSAS